MNPPFRGGPASPRGSRVAARSQTACLQRCPFPQLAFSGRGRWDVARDARETTRARAAAARLSIPGRDRPHQVALGGLGQEGAAGGFPEAPPRRTQRRAGVSSPQGTAAWITPLSLFRSSTSAKRPPSAGSGPEAAPETPTAPESLSEELEETPDEEEFESESPAVGCMTFSCVSLTGSSVLDAAWVGPGAGGANVGGRIGCSGNLYSKAWTARSTGHSGTGGRAPRAWGDRGRHPECKAWTTWT